MQPKSPKLHGNLNLKVTCEVHVEMKKVHEHICSHRSYQYNYLTYRSYLSDLPYHALVVAQHHPGLQLVSQGTALVLPIHRIYEGEDTLRG